MIENANTVVQDAVRIKKGIVINANVCVKCITEAIFEILTHVFLRIVGI